MTSIGACHFPGVSAPLFRQQLKSKSNSILNISRRFAASVEQAATTESTKSSAATSLEKREEAKSTVRQFSEAENERDGERGSLNLSNFFQQSKDLIKSDGGPPQWFSPLECGSQLDNSPLLLFLPGIDGVGLGLILQQQKLGR